MTTGITTYPQKIFTFEKSKKIKEKKALGFCSRIFSPCSNLFSNKTKTLKDKISKISQGIKTDTEWESHEKKVLEAIQSEEYVKCQSYLKQIFKNLTPQKADALLRKTALLGYETGRHDLLNKCLDLISFEQLQIILKHINSDFVEAKQTAEKTLKLLKYIEKYKHTPLNEIVNKEIEKQASTLVTLIHTVINTMLMAFDFLDAGAEPSNRWEATYLLDTYMRLLTIPITILAAIQAYFLNALMTFFAAIAVGTVGFAAIASYVKWFKPPPEELPYCQNLTTEAVKGKINPVIGRDAEIEQLVSSLSANTNGTRRHPLLIGKSGVGKTEIVKGLAYRIAKGQVPESLKGKKVFLVNTAEFIDSGFSRDGDDALQRLLLKIGKGNLDKVIIFFDEIQSAFMTKDKDKQAKIKDLNKLGQRLKSITDTAPGSLKYCIGATTKEEYETYIQKHTPFKRRFKVIEVEETKKEQTMAILRDLINQEAPEIDIDDLALETVFNETDEKIKDRAQPEKSKAILSAAVEQVRNNLKNTNLENQRKLLNEEKEKLSSILARQNVNGFLFSASKAELNRLEEIDESLKNLKKQIENHEKKLKEYKKLKMLRNSQEDTIYQMAQNITNQSAHNKTAEINLQKAFLFSMFYALPSLDQAIQSTAENYELKVKITNEMIQNLVATEARVENNNSLQSQ